MTAMPVLRQFLLVLIVISASLFVPGVQSINAAGAWYVSPEGNDNNPCFTPEAPCATINGAIAKTSSGDTIFVATGTYTSSSGDSVVMIDKSIIISGGWDLLFNTQGEPSVIDGLRDRRGIAVNNDVNATLDRFLVQNGLAFDEGAGIKNQGNLTLTRSIIQNNQVGTEGSAAGIYNSGILILDMCSVRNNSTQGQYFNNAGGIMNDGGSVVLNNSSINGNYAGHYGGGIYNTNLGTLVLNNSTISGNHAGELNLGGGIHNGFPDSGIVFINNSTISNNVSSGIMTHSDTITMQNSILAGNFESDGISPMDCVGPIMSQGYNLVESTWACNFTSTTGDLLNVNPRLFILMGNPAFHPLLDSSPAINAGNPTGCTDHLGNPLNFDQRGVARIERCDIGAFEYDPSNDPFQRNYLPLISKSCLPLYSDSFNNPSSGWPVVDNGKVRVEYLDGEYRILVRPDNWGAIVHPGFQASDYSVTVDLRNTSGVMGSSGIAFGIAQDWSTFYSLEIYPDGWYGIYRWDPSDVVTLSEAFSSAIHQGSMTNQIKVERNGASINAYANGQLLASVTDGNYTGSRFIGLIVFSYDQPDVDIRFDNFAVYPTSCGGLNSLLNAPGRWLPSPGLRYFEFTERSHSNPIHENKK